MLFMIVLYSFAYSVYKCFIEGHPLMILCECGSSVF